MTTGFLTFVEECKKCGQYYKPIVESAECPHNLKQLIKDEINLTEEQKAHLEECERLKKELPSPSGECLNIILKKGEIKCRNKQKNNAS